MLPSNEKDETILTWIIPVYNGETYLAQAIESILNQPCKRFEIIVVDDGSSDHSLEIAKSFTGQGVRVIRKENGGVSSARNLGIENCTTPYIAFLDADDVMCKNAFTEKIAQILNEQKYDLIRFSYYLADQELRRGKRVCVENGEVECDETKLDCYKHFCSEIYSHSLFHGENGICFPERIRINEDVVFHHLAYERGNRALNVDINWFAYRNNNMSVTHNQKNHAHTVMCNSIPAWNWCKSRCTTERAKNVCDARLFASASEAIVRSCRIGDSLESIYPIFEMPYVQEALKNYKNLWSNSKAIYEEFQNNPESFRKKAYRKGTTDRMLYMLSKIPFFRNIYLKLRFKEDIAHLV